MRYAVEVRLGQVRLGEVSPAEVRPYSGMVLSPSIPAVYPFLKPGELF
jgi:hypothetical protein